MPLKGLVEGADVHPKAHLDALYVFDLRRPSGNGNVFFYETRSWCIFNFEPILTQCPHWVIKQDNTVQYNGKLVPSNQHAFSDMRSASAQKTEPSVIVSACVAKGNRDGGQTSALQSDSPNPLQGEIFRPPKALLWSWKTMLMSTHLHLAHTILFGLGVAP